MKNIFRSIIGLFFFSLMTLQLSAQCAHTATNIAGLPATQGVGVGFGQSFLADCMNDEFTDITFSLKNFNNAVWTVELFDGQSDDPADLLYSQTGVVPSMGAANPNSNGGVFYTATLGGGTGSLAYTQGQTYTFICTLESGSHAVEFGFGDQYAQGAQYYSNTSFTSVDNHFEFGSGASSTAMDCNISFLTTHTGGPTFRNFAQSFMGDCTDAGEFSSIAIGYKNGSAGNTSGTLYLHNGESVDASTVFYSQPISIPTGSGAVAHTEIPLGGGTGSLAYTPGQQYTYRIELQSNVTPIAITGYSGGMGFWQNSSFPNGYAPNINDFEFDVVITPVVAPVPTMGEWALITFGLIIMSMGVITVRRREEEMNLQAAS